jgi:transposase-like protein
MAKGLRPNLNRECTEKGVSKPRWSESDKARAVAAYCTVGSYSKAADLTGIPEMTLRYWGRQPWFLEEMHRADQAETLELKSIYTKIAKKATELLEKRIEDGDEVVTRDGDIVHRAVAAKDLAVISGIAMEKRKQAMDTPNIVATQNSVEKLNLLMAEFLKFNAARTLKHEPIEAEYAEQPQLQEKLYAGETDGDASPQESERSSQPSES